MKKRKKELDVDFIGGKVPLTSAEEKALSDFFQKKKKAPKKRLGDIKGKVKNSSSKN